jgi:cytochrome c oxidase subunit IV
MAKDDLKDEDRDEDDREDEDEGQDDEDEDDADENDDGLEARPAEAKPGTKVAVVDAERVEISQDMHAEETHDHGLAHTTPISLLVGVLSVLLVLTIITVIVTRIDLGGQGNLVVAMVIATIKAALVVTYFMHLRWDRRMHLLAFLSSVLFLILFLSMAITDRNEYMPDVLRLQEAQGQQ